jgi:hypothetical protein
MHPVKWHNLGTNEAVVGSCNGRVFSTITATQKNRQYCYYVVYSFGTFGVKYCYDLLETVLVGVEKEFNFWRDNNKVFFEEGRTT